MALRIVSADERLKVAPKVNIALFGPSGVGKTTQARTLDPDTTLFLDGEAGTLALADWRGDVVDMRGQATELGRHPWELARALACWLGGPDPAANPADATDPYGPAMYQAYCQALGDPAPMLAKYKTVFTDSITVASRWSFSWAQRQPEAISDRTGKPDTRGAYGLHGREMIRWLTHLQHCPLSMIVVGILDKEVDDLKRVTFSPQIEGSKAGRELPGIFDQVLTLDTIEFDGGTKARAFVCRQDNPWGYPAKDRSGRLDTIEEPDLGKLLAKIQNGKRQDQNIATALPPPQSPAGAQPDVQPTQQAPAA